MSAEAVNTNSTVPPGPYKQLIADMEASGTSSIQPLPSAADEERKPSNAAEQHAENIAEILRTEPDLVKRAKALVAIGGFNLKDSIKVNSEGAVIHLKTSRNLSSIVKTVLSDEEAVHVNEFHGRIVDHTGRIVDDHYPVLEWLEVFAAAGIKGKLLPTYSEARTALVQTGLALRRNDFTIQLVRRIPEWDGVPRMRRKLIEFFECHDTPLNEDFGEYFWLSSYYRMTSPGCYAPMVLCLIGAQHCGKSYFGKRLAQIFMGDEKADTIPWDLAGERINFLREITGSSPIASIGEMMGLGFVEMNKVKDFVQRTGDPMHYKYEGHFTQPRQWIAMLDGNKYEGLQRDDTGNRRFYPMFCGQDEDDAGKPDWRLDFKVSEAKWAALEAEVWQLMAEAAAWIEERGADGYRRMVDDVSTKVQAFSREEMANERGVVVDDLLSVHLDNAIAGCAVYSVPSVKRNGTPTAHIDVRDLLGALSELTEKQVEGSAKLTRAMEARGARRAVRAVKAKKIVRGKEFDVKTTVATWRFDDCKDGDDLVELMSSRADRISPDVKGGGECSKSGGGGVF